MINNVRECQPASNESYSTGVNDTAQQDAVYYYTTERPANFREQPPAFSYALPYYSTEGWNSSPGSSSYRVAVPNNGPTSYEASNASLSNYASEPPREVLHSFRAPFNDDPRSDVSSQDNLPSSIQRSSDPSLLSEADR